jgi:hypothetical protein
MWDFLKNKEVDSLDKVPEDVRPFYEKSEETGKFILSGSDIVKSAVKVIVGQQRALTAARSESADHKKKAVDLSPLSEWGGSPKEISEAVKSKVDELQQEIAKGKDASLDLEKIKATMNTSFEKERNQFRTENAALEGQLKKHLVVNAATAAIVKAGGSPKLLMPHVQGKVGTSTEGKDKEYKVFIKDEEGKPRFSGVNHGEHMSIGELVEEMKQDEDYGRMFNSDAPSGGGAIQSSRPTPPKPGEKLSPNDKISRGIKKKQFKQPGQA